MNKLLLIVIGAACAAACTACPQRPASQAAGHAGPAGSSGAPSAQTRADTADAAAETPAQAASRPPGEFFPPSGPPTQVILFYTGDTLSTVQPKRSTQSTEGGLCALAQAIAGYQSQLVDLNRLRVENEGGDPVDIRADLDAGLLGEHPYLLMDYGGWERPNDFAGAEYVALYFRFFKDYRYCAVAGRLYERLSAERWQAYRALDYTPSLLVTGAPVNPAALDCQPLVTRELHGQVWGIAAPPLPAPPAEGGPADAPAALAQAMAGAQARLAEAGCEFSILLLAEAPTSVYRAQAEESPFTVIIGADRRTGVKEGYGEMPAHGALLLPVVDGSGRGAAVCHLYFEPDGDQPVMYFFTLLRCEDDETQPWPYRRLVREAAVRHSELVKAGDPGAAR